MSDTGAGVVFLLTLIAALVLIYRPFGDYIARVMTGTRHLAVERGIYRAGGVGADADQTWGRYLRSVLAFSVVGVLFLYGPYRREGRHTAPSNAAFDLQLRSRDPSWGVRDLETVVALGLDRGLDCIEAVEMPANNLSVVFRRLPHAEQ